MSGILSHSRFTLTSHHLLNRFNCKKCPQPGKFIPFHKVPEETVKGILDDLAEWDHYSSTKKLKVCVGRASPLFVAVAGVVSSPHAIHLTCFGLQDTILRDAAGDVVSFVFRAQSHENPIPDAPTKEELEEAERKDKERESMFADDGEGEGGGPGAKGMDEGDDA